MLKQFKKFQAASNNLIRLITIACEKDVDYELTKYLVSQGIRVSLGHSACNYKESYLAFANGATFSNSRLQWYGWFPSP